MNGTLGRTDLTRNRLSRTARGNLAHKLLSLASCRAGRGRRHGIRSSLLLLAIALGQQACSRCEMHRGRHDEGIAQGQSGIVPAAHKPSSKTCAPIKHDAGYVEFDVSGKRRRFYLVPPREAGKPVDLVIGFHGRSRSGEHAAHTWALEEQSKRPFVGLYPDGQPQPWFRNLVGWDTRSEVSTDLPLFDALVDWAVAEYCVDRSRVHVLGHSWGGGMSNLVACARNGIHSVVSVGGGGPTFPCQGPVAAIIAHGLADQEEPITSGRLNVASWTFYNRCGSDPQPASVAGCVEYAGCMRNRPVLWCEHPGGHGWPDLFRHGSLMAWLQRD